MNFGSKMEDWKSDWTISQDFLNEGQWTLVNRHLEANLTYFKVTKENWGIKMHCFGHQGKPLSYDQCHLQTNNTSLQ